MNWRLPSLRPVVSAIVIMGISTKLLGAEVAVLIKE